MIDYKHRSLKKELLDQNDIPFEDIVRNMKELDFINTHLGGHSITISGFKELLQNRKKISVCEIGCGGGDNLNALYQFCKKNKIEALFTGIDINKDCIAFAKENSEIDTINFIVADYRNVDFSPEYSGAKPDIIFSSLFCHHFTDDELVEMLHWMALNSGTGFFINDLHRHPLAYHFIKITTQLFSKSYLVKNDAPLSVLRGFKKNEWKHIFKEAGINNYSIKWKWAFRHQIVCVYKNALNIEMLQKPLPLQTDLGRPVSIIGGGLAGLSLSILLAKAGHEVILFEKEKYPFHKVCGEYISMESWRFIESLGLNLSALDLPVIKKLIVSSPDGNFLKAKLDLGGFGISRYFLDNELKEIALKLGVIIHEETKVNEIIFQDEIFTIKYNKGEITSSVVAASFGKRSNLDVKWQRDFIKQKPGKLNNYVGVKYHIKNEFSEDTIALHNFKNGYCGISKVENNKYCLCYLTTAQNLKDNNNSIKEMEKNVLHKNPFLKEIFSESEFLFMEPVVISQISFDKKTQVENHVLLLGDAAGMITPLCGNGMSMAFHSAKIAFENINSFLTKKISREEMEDQYAHQWQKQFGNRLRNGRIIQKFFGKERLTNLFIKAVKRFPFVIPKMIKATHGKEF